MDNFFATLFGCYSIELNIGSHSCNSICFLIILLRWVRSFVCRLKRSRFFIIFPALFSLVSSSLPARIIYFYEICSRFDLETWFFLLLFLLLHCISFLAWTWLICFGWLICVILLFLFQDETLSITMLFCFKYLRLWKVIALKYSHQSGYLRSSCFYMKLIFCLLRRFDVLQDALQFGVAILRILFMSDCFGRFVCFLIFVCCRFLILVINLLFFDSHRFCIDSACWLGFRPLIVGRAKCSYFLATGKRSSLL